MNEYNILFECFSPKSIEFLLFHAQPVPTGPSQNSHLVPQKARIIFFLFWILILNLICLQYDVTSASES